MRHISQTTGGGCRPPGQGLPQGGDHPGGSWEFFRGMLADIDSEFFLFFRVENLRRTCPAKDDARGSGDRARGVGRLCPGRWLPGAGGQPRRVSRASGGSHPGTVAGRPGTYPANCRGRRMVLGGHPPGHLPGELSHGRHLLPGLWCLCPGRSLPAIRWHRPEPFSKTWPSCRPETGQAYPATSPAARLRPGSPPPRIRLCPPAHLPGNPCTAPQNQSPGPSCKHSGSTRPPSPPRSPQSPQSTALL